MPERLIERRHEAAGVQSSAHYSPCGLYRYALTREWEPTGPRLLYVMLNPSTATEAQNDPTIDRCERRARALGFGAFRATNLFGWRETDPALLRRTSDPVGALNDEVILASLTGWLRQAADMALCSWGVHGTLRDRARQVAARMAGTGRPLHCLGTTKQGHPRHPLYVSYATRPRPWDPTAVNH